MAPTPEVTRNVSNQSSRAPGSKIRLIVLHTTEGHNRPGLSDLEGLGTFFDNPRVEASSHVANDAEGYDARFVPDSRKAWTQAAFNSVSLSIEQIGFAATSRAAWLKNNHKQLHNTAAWIAYWSRKHDIPIRKAWVRGTTVIRSGVIQHSGLGAAGGGHHDCGEGYPFEYVLDLARKIKGGNTPAPTKPAFPGTLRKGDKGQNVLTLQQRLRHRGWSLVADGIFGAKTEDTVRAFQRNKKLTVDGIVGPKTWNALWS